MPAVLPMVKSGVSEVSARVKALRDVVVPTVNVLPIDSLPVVVALPLKVVDPTDKSPAVKFCKPDHVYGAERLIVWESAKTLVGRPRARTVSAISSFFIWPFILCATYRS